MRDLMKLKTLLNALSLGLSVAVLCVPFLILMTPAGPMRTLRIAFLVPLSIILFQVGIAWTPLAEGREMIRLNFDVASYLRLVLVSLVMAVVGRVAIDPMIALVAPNYFPETMRELVVSLPWMALFQPLVFVVGCYAFTVRLGRRPSFGLAAVVAGHQIIVFMQLDPEASVTLRAALVLVAGGYALALGLAYRAYGFIGPAIIAYVAQLRHILLFV